MSSLITQTTSSLNGGLLMHADLRCRPARRLFLEGLEDRRLMALTALASYPTDVNPQSAITADFNADGRPDLAAINLLSNDVSVLLGNADGTFQPAVNSASGGYAYAGVAGDFNGDGRIDL